ncbi:MAG: hypothetical protein H6739_37265 [Alphaproteobacteria bacterium]|nr:hypothetical protein [Alphaproteobacteria bacterium]
MRLLLLAPVALAAAPMNGGYVLVSSQAELAAEKERAIERTLAEMNFALRPLAARELEGVVNWCQSYEMTRDATQFTVSCDGKPPVVAPLDGSEATFTNRDGERFPLGVQVRGDAIWLKFSGEQGHQEVLYTGTADGLVVEKSIHSPFMEEPLRWTMRYVRK